MNWRDKQSRFTKRIQSVRTKAERVARKKRRRRRVTTSGGPKEVREIVNQKVDKEEASKEAKQKIKGGPKVKKITGRKE